MKNKFIECLKMAVGGSIGTAIYQLVNHSELTFDFYRPAFVGLISFILLYIYYSIKSNKNS